MISINMQSAPPAPQAKPPSGGMPSNITTVVAPEASKMLSNFWEKVKLLILKILFKLG